MANTESGRGRRRGRRSNSRGPSRGDAPGASAQNPVRAAFVACSRCGHFLAGYRAATTQEHLDEIMAVDDDWLQLQWSPSSGALLEAAFGVRVSDADQYFSLVCPECHRAYVIQEEDGGGVTFQVEVMPRLRR